VAETASVNTKRSNDNGRKGHRKGKGIRSRLFISDHNVNDTGSSCRLGRAIANDCLP